MSADTEKKPVDEEILVEGKHRRGLRLAILDDSLELREKGGDGGDDSPVMRGHFAVFNEWTEINSFWEGNFMERISPGAFKKTFKEQRNTMRCLFQHGKDPQVGSKPLGTIDVLREDDTGAEYEVPLFEANYVTELLPALRAGEFGASFRFQVIREDINEEPGRSEHNPDGIAERTIKEMRVFEFGPVTFPAYDSATAGLRSITDDFVGHGFTEFAREDPERMRDFIFDQLAADPERLQTLVGAKVEDNGRKVGRAKGTAPPKTTPKSVSTDSTSLEDSGAAKRSRIVNSSESKEPWRLTGRNQ